MAAHPISPRTKKRSSSLKKPHRRLLENTELEDMRPRTTSLPTRNEINRPGRKYLTPISDQEYSVHPLRSFVTTPKGLINRGDSMRSRSNSSVVSSCSGSMSELAPQSRLIAEKPTICPRTRYYKWLVEISDYNWYRWHGNSVLAAGDLLHVYRL